MILKGLETLIGKTITGYERYEITDADNSFTFYYDVFFVGDDIVVQGVVEEHYAYCWFYPVMGLTGNMPDEGVLKYQTELFPEALKDLIIKHSSNEN